MGFMVPVLGLGSGAATALTVASGVLSVGSAIAGAQAAGEAGAMNQSMFNAQADYIEQKTAADVEAHRRDFARFEGALRADIAAHGGSTETDTGMLFLRDAAAQGKLDELNIITEGSNAATSARNRGAVANFEGQTRRTQGFLGAAANGFRAWDNYREVTA